MPEYHFSLEAKEDLIRIAQYGDKNFGMARSDLYRNKLQQKFVALAQAPLASPAVDYIRKDYRRSIVVFIQFIIKLRIMAF